MKKILLSICLLSSFGAAFAQNYWALKSVGTSTPYNMNDASGTVVHTGTTASPVSAKLSSAITLPFSNWTFYGNVVTQCKVSTSGYITFDLNQTTDITLNTALPNAAAPKNAIFAFWDKLTIQALTQGTNTFPSDVKTFTYGSAPNRVFVIQWRLTGTIGQATPGTNVTYFAIRLYEAGNFDIVHNYGFGTFGATVGTQNADNTKGFMVAGSPEMNFGGPNGNYTASLSDVYTFQYGIQPSFETALTRVTLPRFILKGTNVKLTGSLKNFGKEDITAIKVYYSVDGGPKVTGTLADLNILNTGGTADFEFPTPVNFTTGGVKTIKIWTDNPNLNPDQNTSNDTLVITQQIFNTVVPRKVLHEVFTSSTCPPCKPGNEKLDGVLAPATNKDKWNVIKYQVNFPGNGDPYYTAEIGTRFAYYGASFAPWLTVDGNFNDNANDYTNAIFDEFKAVNSVLTITATQTLVGKTITVSGTVTPTEIIPNTNLKLRIAVIETRTEKNVKTNQESEFFNVVKKMLPNADGTAISFTAGTAVPFTQSFTFPGTYRLPSDGRTNIINLATENSVEEFGNLQAIVFVEDDTEKQVWQSQSTAAVFPLNVKTVNKNNQFNVYPNPAQSNFVIEFNNETAGSIRIVDVNGKEVYNTSINSMNQTIDCSNLNNGLYFVQIEANGVITSQKLNIAK